MLCTNIYCSMQKNVKNKVLVIGLDGATFDVIEKAGYELPNLKELMGRGSYGTLRTVNPPVTCPAWPSFVTGKKPGNHNTFDFMKLDKKTGDIKLANSSMIKSTKIWDLVSDSHKKVGVMEIPITFPAKKINGMMITGYPSPNSKDNCYPRDIIKKIKTDVGAFYDLMPGNFKAGKEIKVLKKFEATAKNRGEIVSYLLRNGNWDLFMVNFHHTDICSHYFWHTHDPTHPKYNDKIEDIVLRGYKLMDCIVGAIMKDLDKNTYVFIISDHGHGKLLKIVNLNIFLLEKGYVKLRNSIKTKLKYSLFKMGFTPSFIYSVTKKIDLQNIVTKLGRSTRDKALNKFLSYSDIDWNKTLAYSFGHVGQIYINKKEAKDKLITDLKKLKDPETGKPLVDEIFKKEAIYSGEYIDNAPDLVLRMKNYEYISYPLFASNNRIFAEPLNDHTGCHRMNGVFIAKGPQIKKGAEQKDMEIIDVAPTVLHILDIPVPKDMDGKVLEDIFEESSELAKKPIKYQEFDEKDKIRAILRDLRAKV